MRLIAFLCSLYTFPCLECQICLNLHNVAHWSLFPQLPNLWLFTIISKLDLHHQQHTLNRYRCVFLNCLSLSGLISSLLYQPKLFSKANHIQRSLKLCTKLIGFIIREIFLFLSLLITTHCDIFHILLRHAVILFRKTLSHD